MFSLYSAYNALYCDLLANESASTNTLKEMVDSLDVKTFDTVFPKVYKELNTIERMLDETAKNRTVLDSIAKRFNVVKVDFLNTSVVAELKTKTNEIIKALNSVLSVDTSNEDYDELHDYLTAAEYSISKLKAVIAKFDKFEEKRFAGSIKQLAEWYNLSNHIIDIIYGEKSSSLKAVKTAVDKISVLKAVKADDDKIECVNAIKAGYDEINSNMVKLIKHELVNLLRLYNILNK